MLRRCQVLYGGLLAAALAASLSGLEAAVPELEFDQPPHNYWKHPLRDPVTRLKADIESGRVELDRTSEKAFLLSLLKVLGIAPSSQLLVFSTTSLQLRLISPSNPRALYFNEEVYVGFIPGGRLEVVSIDPELGGIFYIFDIPRGSERIRFERSDRCMNCHAGEDTGDIPGLVARSVLPGPSGGSLKAFRGGRTGHGIPLAERLGGWYVTGEGALTNHWGNLIGQSSPAGPVGRIIRPGTAFDFTRYAAATSDVLAHLLHEHQVGFVNRAVQATYLARTCLHEGQGHLTADHAQILDQCAESLVRYLLFADEVPLPAGGVAGDPLFKQAFLRERRTAAGGISLKDFDLETRLFRYRCSYLIYSALFENLPAAVSKEVNKKLRAALDERNADVNYAYLPRPERQAIRRILRETLPAFASDW